MFEFYIACKYLTPRRKTFSTSFVAFVSIFVIALVVWLILLFLSVTSGLEKKWVQRLTSLHAPIRLTPTEFYYHSYYYQVDRFSSASDYTLKTIGEKALARLTDPYCSEVDPEMPTTMAPPDRFENGMLKDPVQGAYALLHSLQTKHPTLTFQDYEIAGALLRIEKKKSGKIAQLSQVSYLLSLPEKNPYFSSLLIEYHPELAHSAGIAPLILPKAYQDQGIQVGDRGTLGYSASSAVSFQEQRLPFLIVGFYDPGIIPMGNRCVIAPMDMTRAIRTASAAMMLDTIPQNGIFVWTRDPQSVAALVEQLRHGLRDAGLASYWHVLSYEDFEFSKDLVQQFRSDKTLFMLIAILILLVACCNILSLLLLLVHEKRREIAILQSMGASRMSIAWVFGLCGGVMGSVGSLVGTGAALLTLHYLDVLVAGLSALQGHTAFHPAFFGQTLPNQFSVEALGFVLIVTPLLSLIAGIIPAYKAVCVAPSIALRSE